MDQPQLNVMTGIVDASMNDLSITPHMLIDPRTGGAQPLSHRAINSEYLPLSAGHFAQPPMGPLPYFSNGPQGAYANRPMPLLTSPTGITYPKFESISELLASDSAEFEYNTEMNAVLHTGKCPDCVQFSLHIQ